MISLMFYTTSACHLCDEAELVLASFLQQQLISIQKIDIVESDDLLELYGIRIPVIKREDTNQELSWPFNRDLIADFIAG